MYRSVLPHVIEAGQQNSNTGEMIMWEILIWAKSIVGYYLFTGFSLGFIVGAIVAAQSSLVVRLLDNGNTIHVKGGVVFTPASNREHVSDWFTTNRATGVWFKFIFFWPLMILFRIRDHNYFDMIEKIK